jgi:glycosyltransferase involved in cell wall biosynthesis
VFYRRSSNAFGQNPLKQFFNFCLNKLVYYNATKILANSRYALDYFHPNNYRETNKFRVIYNGLIAEKFQITKDMKELRRSMGIPENAFVIGHIGRYDKAKNHETILEVAEMLIKNDSAFHFVFCGLNTDSQAFEELVKEKEIYSNTNLLGISSNIPQILKTFNLFYFPSITESQPNALIEAMLADLPVLASDIPPIKEIIPENKQALLVKPTDVNQAVNRLMHLKENQEELEKYKMKQWAIEKFDANKNFKAFEDCLIK